MAVDYRRLEKEIPSIAARVERLSGLKVPLDDLSFEWVDNSSDQKGRYLFQEKKIILNKERIYCLESQNYLTIVLGHELMHHAQCSIPPFRELIETVSTAARSLTYLPLKYRHLERLVEGDATWMLFELGRFYPPSFPNIEYRLYKTMVAYAGITSKLDGGSISDIYGMGKRRIDALVASGGRAAVNRLYLADLKEISDNFRDSAIKLRAVEKHLLIGANGLADLTENIGGFLHHFLK